MELDIKKLVSDLFFLNDDPVAQNQLEFFLINTVNTDENPNSISDTEWLPFANNEGDEYQDLFGTGPADQELQARAFDAISRRFGLLPYTNQYETNIPLTTDLPILIQEFENNSDIWENHQVTSTTNNDFSTPGPYGVEEETITLNKHQYQIYSPDFGKFTLSSDTSFPVVYLAHGAGSTFYLKPYLENLIIKHLVSHGFIVVTDFDSQSNNMPTMIIEDAIEKSKTKFGASHIADGVTLIGHSMGGDILRYYLQQKNNPPKELEAPFKINGIILFGESDIWWPDAGEMTQRWPQTHNQDLNILFYYEPDRTPSMERNLSKSWLDEKEEKFCNERVAPLYGPNSRITAIMDEKGDHVIWNQKALAYYFTVFLKASYATDPQTYENLLLKSQPGIRILR